MTDEPDKRLTVRVDQDVSRTLAALASLWKTSEVEIARQALHEFLIRHDPDYAQRFSSRPMPGVDPPSLAEFQAMYHKLAKELEQLKKLIPGVETKKSE